MKRLAAALLLTVGILPRTVPATEATLGAPEIRAQLVAVRTTVLSAELAGRITELSVREGERFKEGQSLVGFDCALHRARAERAQAQLQAARKAHQVKSRLDKLGSISTMDLELAAAELAAAESESKMMRVMVERCTIVAPYPGRVVDLKVNRHQFVGEGDELIEILDDRELEIELNVPSRWQPWIEPGTPFRLRVEETGKTYDATVLRLAARIDPLSQTLRIFGKVAETANDLMAGMSGSASFTPP